MAKAVLHVVIKGFVWNNIETSLGSSSLQPSHCSVPNFLKTFSIVKHCYHNMYHKMYTKSVKDGSPQIGAELIAQLPLTNEMSFDLQMTRMVFL